MHYSLLLILRIYNLKSLRVKEKRFLNYLSKKFVLPLLSEFQFSSHWRGPDSVHSRSSHGLITGL